MCVCVFGRERKKERSAFGGEKGEKTREKDADDVGVLIYFQVFEKF